MDVTKSGLVNSGAPVEDDDGDDLVFGGQDDEPQTPDDPADDDAVTLNILWHGQVVEIDFDEFTGLDHARFRQTLGMSIGDGLKGGALDGIACLLWLKLRRTNRKLKYQQVAKRLTLNDILDDDDPRAKGGASGPEL